MIDAAGTPLAGLYAAGEAACVSVHGANRLGTNSLTDLIVFGRRAGKHMAAFCQGADFAPLPANPTGEVEAELERIRRADGARKRTSFAPRCSRSRSMSASSARRRVGRRLTQCAVSGQYRHNLGIDDRGKRFNTTFEA